MQLPSPCPAALTETLALFLGRNGPSTRAEIRRALQSADGDPPDTASLSNLLDQQCKRGSDGRYAAAGGDSSAALGMVDTEAPVAEAATSGGFSALLPSAAVAAWHGDAGGCSALLDLQPSAGVVMLPSAAPGGGGGGGGGAPEATAPHTGSVGQAMSAGPHAHRAMPGPLPSAKRARAAGSPPSADPLLRRLEAGRYPPSSLQLRGGDASDVPCPAQDMEGFLAEALAAAKAGVPVQYTEASAAPQSAEVYLQWLDEFCRLLSAYRRNAKILARAGAYRSACEARSGSGQGPLPMPFVCLVVEVQDKQDALKNVVLALKKGLLEYARCDRSL